MEKSGIIKVENRTLTGSSNVKKLRRSGYLPATICSKEIGSIMVTLKKDAFLKTISKYGRSAVLELEADDGKTYNAMLKTIQIAPVTGDYLHVVFQQVSLTKETKADVKIKIDGKDSIESRKLTLLQQLDVVSVKGLPNSIPNSIDIDVANLQAGDKIFIKDLHIPEGISIDGDPEQIVASVIEPRTQVQESEDAENDESAQETQEAKD